MAEPSLMSKCKLSQSFLIRVYTKQSKLFIRLQDIRTGQSFSFESWRAVLEHIEKCSKSEGLR